MACEDCEPEDLGLCTPALGVVVGLAEAPGLLPLLFLCPEFLGGGSPGRLPYLFFTPNYMVMSVPCSVSRPLSHDPIQIIFSLLSLKS